MNHNFTDLYNDSILFNFSLYMKSMTTRYLIIVYFIELIFITTEVKWYIR